MAYADLLKDMRWQKKRLETLEDAGWRCELMGETGDGVSLNVHHRRYIQGAKPWEYERADLVVLCEECHEDWHEWKQGFDRNTTTEFVSDGVTSRRVWWLFRVMESLDDDIGNYKIRYTDGSFIWSWVEFGEDIQDAEKHRRMNECARLERKALRFKKFQSGEVALS